LNPGGRHLVFFDGVCGLCDRTVRFLLRHDRRDRLRFAPLQGETARRMLPPLGGRPEDLDTIYVITAAGKLLRRSKAVLFAVSALGGGWALLAALRVIPSPLMDLLYRLVARVRYHLFERFEACAMPPPQERARFLEATLDQISSSSTGK
jgi:predicted DCC family thiol-disulfide oxidoreductase YuxK